MRRFSHVDICSHGCRKFDRSQNIIAIFYLCSVYRGFRTKWQHIILAEGITELILIHEFMSIEAGGGGI